MGKTLKVRPPILTVDNPENYCLISLHVFSTVPALAVWSRRMEYSTYVEAGMYFVTFPLSSCSIIESCVFAVLLNGAEQWIQNITLLKQLESFQAEIAKRIL